MAPGTASASGARWSRPARSTLGDAVAGVRERGRLMQEAVPPGVGAMAAVMGLDAAEVAALCDEAARRRRARRPPNLNGAGQVVVAGHAARGRARSWRWRPRGARARSASR